MRRPRRPIRHRLGGRSGDGHSDKTTEKEFVGMATKREWTDWEKEQKASTHVVIDKLFVDYFLD